MYESVENNGEVLTNRLNLFTTERERDVYTVSQTKRISGGNKMQLNLEFTAPDPDVE